MLLGPVWLSDAVPLELAKVWAHMASCHATTCWPFPRSRPPGTFTRISQMRGIEDEDSRAVIIFSSPNKLGAVAPLPSPMSHFVRQRYDRYVRKFTTFTTIASVTMPSHTLFHIRSELCSVTKHLETSETSRKMLLHDRYVHGRRL